MKRRHQKAMMKKMQEEQDSQGALFSGSTSVEGSVPEVAAPQADDTAPRDEPVAGGDAPADGRNDAPFLAELDKARAEAREYLDLAQRARADLENFRKRVQRDRESDRLLVLADFVRELLVPVNDLSRALQAADKDRQFDALRDGLAMIHAAVWKILDGRDIRRIETTGQPFDPNVHEAMLQMPSPHVPAGVVIDEIAPGYIMKDICLQAAKVAVSAGAPEQAVCGEDDETCEPLRMQPDEES